MAQQHLRVGAVVLGALTSFASAAPRSNSPPTVTIVFPDGTWAHAESEIAVRITVDDPDGDRVSARLTIGPASFVMRPIVDELPPVTREIRWYARRNEGGRQRIVVAAHDAAAPSITVHGDAHLDVVGGGFNESVRIFDVDGDFLPELVVADPSYTVNGVKDAGAILVFDPRQPPSSAGFTPRAMLHSSTPTANARLGEWGQIKSGHCLQQADLNGDGKLDLIAAGGRDSSEIYVWYGGANGKWNRPEDAKLTAPTKPNFNADNCAQWLLFHDVTGDGQEDVVAVAPDDSTSVNQSGAIHIYKGGAGIAGTVTPTATLRLKNAHTGDQLGGSNSFLDYHVASQCVMFHDVTGDGIDDVVALAAHADVNGVKDAGVVAVWAGGSGLTGTVLPLATLSAGDHLGHHDSANDGRVSRWSPIEFGDMNGDGIDDIVAAAPKTRGNEGRLYLWPGGSALVGSPAPIVTFYVTPGNDFPSLLSDDFFGVVDFTGDGLADIVASARGADAGGVIDAGPCFLFKGRTNFNGATLPDATFGDVIAQEQGMIFQQPHLVDVTGDGVKDLVVVAPEFTTSAGPYCGAVHVWRGGVNYAGSAPLTAECTSPKDPLGGRMGQNLSQAKIRFADLTGDGVLDFILPSYEASRDPINTYAGAVYVFEGGAALSGAVSPRARLFTPRREFYDVLGIDATNFRFEDVTGDGVADVVTTYAAHAMGSFPPYGPTTLPGPSNHFSGYQGAVLVFAGGATLTGTPTSIAQFVGASANEQLGLVHCADVTGDGTLDVLATSEFGGVGSAYGCGRGYVLQGGANIARARPTLFARAAPHKSDQAFFSFNGNLAPLLIADLDDDGADDCLARAPQAWVGGSKAIGALLWFPNGKAGNGGLFEFLCGQHDPYHTFGR